MTPFVWDPAKNEWLKQARDISFEEVVFHIEIGDAIETFKHPNQAKYPGQRVMVVRIEDYAYLVPYFETDEGILLKTIIPSRKATKKYLGKTDE